MERNGREEGEVSMDEEQNFIIKLYGTKFISFIHPLLLSATPSSLPTASPLPHHPAAQQVVERLRGNSSRGLAG